MEALQLESKSVSQVHMVKYINDFFTLNLNGKYIIHVVNRKLSTYVA